MSYLKILGEISLVVLSVRFMVSNDGGYTLVNKPHLLVVVFVFFVFEV